MYKECFKKQHNFCLSVFCLVYKGVVYRSNLLWKSPCSLRRDGWGLLNPTYWGVGCMTNTCTLRHNTTMLHTSPGFTQFTQTGIPWLLSLSLNHLDKILLKISTNRYLSSYWLLIWFYYLFLNLFTHKWIKNLHMILYILVSHSTDNFSPNFKIYLMFSTSFIHHLLHLLADSWMSQINVAQFPPWLKMSALLYFNL